MYRFRYGFNPVLRFQLGAQLAFFDGLSRGMLLSLQQMWQLNLQLGRGILRPGAGPGQRTLTTGIPTPPPPAAPGDGAATHREDEAARRFRHSFRAHGIHQGRIDGMVRDSDREADAAVDIDGPTGTVSAQGNMRGNRLP